MKAKKKAKSSMKVVDDLSEQDYIDFSEHSAK